MKTLNELKKDLIKIAEISDKKKLSFSEIRKLMRQMWNKMIWARKRDRHVKDN